MTNEYAYAVEDEKFLIAQLGESRVQELWECGELAQVYLTYDEVCELHSLVEDRLDEMTELGSIYSKDPDDKRRVKCLQHLKKRLQGYFLLMLYSPKKTQKRKEKMAEMRHKMNELRQSEEYTR